MRSTVLSAIQGLHARGIDPLSFGVWTFAGILAFLLGFVGLAGPLVILFIACVVTGLIRKLILEDDARSELNRARMRRGKRKAPRAPRFQIEP